MATDRKELTVMVVHVLDVVGDALPLCHDLFSTLGCAATPMKVVHCTLPPGQNLLTVALLPQRLNLLGEP